MIQNESMIVSLSIGMWTARKHDKKITEEVRETHNASSDAGRYNKALISKEHMEAIHKVQSTARTFHYDNTLPWGDNNERLLPAANYFTYMGKMNELKSDFERAVAGFISNYDAVIDEAKIRLNGMFNERDYPSKLEIESKFNFKTTFMPVPETDFRVKLQNDELEKLKQSVETEITNRLNQAVSDTWERIKTQLTHMKERLSDKKAIFRDSLFENLRELIQLLPKLNVTGDPNIELACNEMATIMANPDAVRNNDRLREEKAEQVNKVLNQFSSFFGN